MPQLNCTLICIYIAYLDNKYDIHVHVVSLLPMIQWPTEYLINAQHGYFLDILSKTKQGVIAYDFLSLHAFMRKF